jgi:hypothetical protein
VGAGTDGGRAPGRVSARRTTETLLRLLRGEPLESVAQELGVTAATLAQGREQCLAGGQAALRSRPADEIQQRWATVGPIRCGGGGRRAV